MADSLDSLILGMSTRCLQEIARLQSAEPLQSDKTKKGVAAPLNQHAEPNDNHEDEELEALFNEWSTEGLLGNPEPREKPSGASDQKPIKQTALREATKASAALRSNEKENHVASGAVAAVAVNPPLLTTTSGLLSKRLSTGPTQGAPPSSIGDRSFDASSVDKPTHADGLTEGIFAHSRLEESLDPSRNNNNNLQPLSEELIKANLGRHEAERMARRAQESLEAKIADLEKARATDDLRARDEVERLNWKVERAREELEDERGRYEERLRRLEEQRSLDKQRSEEELRRAVSDEAKRQELAIERLVYQHRREVEALKSDHEREIHMLRRKHEAEIASLKASSGEREKLSELTAQMVAHMAQWEDMANAVKGSTAITEQMKTEQLSARENFVKSLETSMKEQQRQIEVERCKLSELTREIEEEQKQHRLTRETESQRLQLEHVRLQELQQTARQMQRDSKSALVSRETAAEMAVRDLNEQKLALESQRKGFRTRPLRSEWEKLRCVQKSTDLSLMATQRRANEAEAAVARHRDRAAAEIEAIERQRVEEDTAELNRKLNLLREQEADVRADMAGVLDLATRLNSRAQQVAQAYAAAEHVRAEAHRLHAELNDRESELTQGAKELEEMKKLELTSLTVPSGGAGLPPASQTFHGQAISMSRVTTRPQLLRSAETDKWRKLKEEAMLVDEYIFKNQQALTTVRTMTTTTRVLPPQSMPPQWNVAAFNHFPIASTYPPPQRAEMPQGAVLLSPGTSASQQTFVPLQGSPQTTTFWRPNTTGHGSMNILSPRLAESMPTIARQEAPPSAPLEPLSSLTSSDQEGVSRGHIRPASIPPLNVPAVASDS
ncbi:hypothetical protein FOZ60_015433 [Perkinsus olseni]|uniref:Uncharacterized protein n=1 Tax=Perkinsus olseni TaxID=32597 RepID=A0A7J6P6R9_PEROL|nr:hypothetical protein FOZ60_015433 [Perkinsus olseni]